MTGPPMSQSAGLCPITPESGVVELAHGGGGLKTQRLINDLFVAEFGSAVLERQEDSATLDLPGGRVALTTDSYVVTPLIFPGGDIGKLAAIGTLNDLAMVGARPLALTVGFVLEEGLQLTLLRDVVRSMAAVLREAGTQVVAGDTKVVDRGRGDGLYVNTTGLGHIEHSRTIGPSRIEEGDVVLVSGDLGRHGIAVLSVREGMAFDHAPVSDCALLWPAIAALLDAGIDLHCARDLTRGGLGAALNELAASAKVHIQIEDAAIPVSDGVSGACELLGLDPLYVANEGRFVAFVPEEQGARALNVLSEVPVCHGAVAVGRVLGRHLSGQVSQLSPFGTHRVLDWLSAEQLPRIC